ncbi:MAG: NGG1p interacting factor NIF3 [Spirochaetales bacterium]|nr:NGG1p interacting factor NIF3 [Spirochaetales bacterium]
MTDREELFHVWVYVPKDAKEKVKQAMFEAGAGEQGRYRCCSWETAGTGQFLPMEGSRPALGRPGRLEYVEEYKVEMVVRCRCLDQTVAALKQAHPYEEPAWGAVPLVIN